MADQLGDAGTTRCVCALNHASDLGRCTVHPDTCTTFLTALSSAAAAGTSVGAILGNWTGCAVLQAACRPPSPAYQYLLADADTVLDCLRSAPLRSSDGKWGVRCPELGPSDLWGLFPVGCTSTECANAGAWVSGGSGDVVFEGARFLSEGRAGLRLPNYRHINSTYHSTITYAQLLHASRPADLNQRRCFESDELSPSAAEEDAVPDFSAEDEVSVLRTLFPAAQLVHDSPLVAVCTRFVVEEARAEALSGTPSARNAALQAAQWRRRCEAKVRQASACNLTGVYFGIAPPVVPDAVTAPCGVRLQLPPRAGDAAYLASRGGGDAVYLTPGCVLVDRVTRLMYDAPLCARVQQQQQGGGGAGASNKGADGAPLPLLLADWGALSLDACGLRPQPLSLLKGNAPYSMVYTAGAQPLSSDWLSNLARSQLTLDSIDATATANAAPSRDQVSHVLDWWSPTAPLKSPPGFHITAPSDPSELAPLVFDSHYLYDPDTYTLFYAHSAARNASLLYNTLGTAGVCRATNVALPMFDANTNRICTRRSKASDADTPQMPVQTLKRGGGPEETVAPFSNAYMDRYFYAEQCAPSARDVPWSVLPTADDDPQSATAGGIPGWQRYVSMTAQGATTYQYAHYPPTATSSTTYQLSDLYDGGDDEGGGWWGPCADTVRWGTTTLCNPKSPSASAGCPPDVSLCVPIVDNTTITAPEMLLQQQLPVQGVCVSAGTYVDSGGERQPCFQTSQCADGLVCLADGACAPLHLHVWNRMVQQQQQQSTDSSPTPTGIGGGDMEFTVLADACGFQEGAHPYTQSMRGASPWEVVPDLLHAHGFCSHRDWFAYRNALWSQTCPMRHNNGGGGSSESAPSLPRTGSNYIGNQGGDGAFLQCNTTEARWPWVHARFDMGRSGEPFQTMAEGHHLLSVPHACDAPFMHLQNPDTGRRLEVCSGFQGRVDVPPRQYELNSSSDDWAGASALLETLDTRDLDRIASRWLRTYDETSGAVHVGVLDNDISRDVPLGFLGAVSGSGSGVLNDMASDMLHKVNFFRCTDRMACSNPSFTYNGVEVKDRLDPVTLAGNFSELSLRLCGAIGYTASQWPNAEIGGGVCWLDVQLFPLFTQLLWGARNNNKNGAGCTALWSPTTALFGGSATGARVVSVDGNAAETLPLSTIQSAPTTLFCETAPPSLIALQQQPPQQPPSGGRCAFAARASTRLTASSEQDAVSTLTAFLNGLLRTAGLVVKTAATSMPRATSMGPTRVYEHINRCAAQLMRTISLTQSRLQAAYGTAGPSGVYIALRVTLYEVPVAWLHHAMLVTLLSILDPSVPEPPLETMGVGGATIPVFLWAEADRAIVCSNQNELNARVVLWRLLCLNSHPAYTFAVDDDPFQQAEPSPPLAADRMGEAIRTRTAQDLRNNLPSNSGRTRAYCHTSVAWGCETLPETRAEMLACQTARILAYNRTVLSSTSSFLEGGGITACEHGLMADLPNQHNAAHPDAWLDPCASDARFKFGGLQQVSLETLGKLNGGPSGGLDKYLSQLTEAALKAAEGAALPVDYMGGGAWDDVVGAGESANRVPVVRAWNLPSLLASSAASASAPQFDLTGWLHTDVCESTFDLVGSMCSDQYATLPGKAPCLFPYTVPGYETERYLQPPVTMPDNLNEQVSDPVIVLHYANHPDEVVPLCDILSASDAGDACIVQYGGRTDAYYAGDGSSGAPDPTSIVPCDIVGVEAPPGVQVQGFALRLPLGGESTLNGRTWLSLLQDSDYCQKDGVGSSCPMSMCTPADANTPPPRDGSQRLAAHEIRSCTWGTSGGDGYEPFASAWWSNGTAQHQAEDAPSTRGDVDGFGPLAELDFGDMRRWWSSSGYASRWKSEGCSDDVGLCALRVRLENTPGVAKAFCGRNVPVANERSITRTRAPQCNAEMLSSGSSSITTGMAVDGGGGGEGGFTPFLIARGDEAALYRCAPCTRFAPVIPANTGSYFKCFLALAPEEADGGEPTPLPTPPSSSSSGSAEDTLTQSAMRLTTRYLHEPAALLSLALAVLASTDTDSSSFSAAWMAATRAMPNGSAIDISAACTPTANPAITDSLLRWGRREHSAATYTASCAHNTPSGCGFTGFKLSYAQTEDALVWNRAVANPNLQFTMLCREQKYTKADAQECNAATDGRRRSLSAFVGQQYRTRNGVWMHTAAPGSGAAWISNVASASVSFFSLMYASTARPERQVLSRWLLGDGPCAPEATVLQHRICAESTARPDLPFEPMHPWVGGDFNPFEKLDECPLPTTATATATAASSSATATGQQQPQQQQQQQQGAASLCACKCTPPRYCDDPSGLHNFSQATMAAESPNLPTCLNQAFARFRTMEPRDESNICAIARDAAFGQYYNYYAQQTTTTTSTTTTTAVRQTQCTHRQGFFAQGVTDTAPRTVTPDELHGTQGVFTPSGSFLVQELYGGQGGPLPSAATSSAITTTTPSTTGNGLWAGRTLLQERASSSGAPSPKYAFLSMPRYRLHPAHIAFANAPELTGAPLTVARVSLLLEGEGEAAAFASAEVNPVDWPLTLGLEWKDDAAFIATLYPQLLRLHPSAAAIPNSDADNSTGGGDWSCPLRAAAFWGGGGGRASSSSSVFAPLAPSPILAHALYGLGGAHPLIRPRSVVDVLRAYRTTNGACFYEAPTAETNILQIGIGDAVNPCGLQGMLRLLDSGEFAPSRVVNRFTTRCNAIIDTPDVGATLRSGETLPPTTGSASPDAPCGVLHRLSPFLMRTRGDAAPIVRAAGGATVRDEGGDCHMGRALMRPLADRASVGGAACALVAKNHSHGVATCPFDGSRLVMARARPLTLQQLVAKHTYYYRSQKLAVPEFRGPGGVLLPEPASSFGLLYATSLRRALAQDLLLLVETGGVCIPDTTSAWAGMAFLQRYAAASRSYSDSGGTSMPPLLNCSSLLSDSSTNNNNKKDDIDYARAANDALWNESRAWAWTFVNRPTTTMTTTSTTTITTTEARGSVNQSWWMDNRFAACNASFRRYGVGANKNSNMAVRPISLCEPAPVATLQMLCKALLQYRTDVANVNCQLMGDGSCLYRPGAFYVPYAWSGTNQEFAADTVLAYYRGIINQKRFANESYTALCPARSDFLAQIAALSRRQAQQCPGYQIEYLKGLLETLKRLGHDMLYMGYCCVMFMVNALGAVFAQSAFALSAMLRLALSYLGEFVKTAANLIMPILNAGVSLIFGTSSVGKLIKEALMVLCETYNLILSKFYVPVWCGVLRPTIYGILQALQSMVGFFDSSAGAKISEVMKAIAMGDGGNIMDVKSCIGSLAVKIDCRSGESAIDDNASSFLPAPVATRCWTDTTQAARMAGANVLGGSSATSFLACTSSDTCAQEPFRFDQSVGTLIACGGCPTVRDDSTQDSAFYGAAQRFGCDTVLKRCTCGVAANTPVSCLSNSDCSQQSNAICAVVSNLDNVGYAGSNMPCSQCGSMGMQPACVRPSAASISGATCACAAVAQAGTLQTCDSALRGGSVSLLQATGFCLSSANYDMTREALSPELVLDFGALTIAPCLTGLSENGCIGVRLPLSSGGQYVRSLIVILAAPSRLIMGRGGSASRRLLSVGQANSLLLDETDVLRGILLMPSSASSSSASESSSAARTCRNALQRGHREQVKWCVHWRMTALAAAQTFNLSHSLWHAAAPSTNHNSSSHSTTTTTTTTQEGGGELLAATNTDALLSWTHLARHPTALWELLVDKPEAARFILKQHDGLAPFLADVMLDVSITTLRIVSRLLERVTTPSSLVVPSKQAGEEGEAAEAGSKNASCSSACSKIGGGRSLLFSFSLASAFHRPAAATAGAPKDEEADEEVTTGRVGSSGSVSAALSSCSALEMPLAKLTEAFWVTAAYYQDPQPPQTNNDNNNNNNNNNGSTTTTTTTTTSTRITYVLPPPSAQPLEQQQQQQTVAILDTLFLGYGRRLVDAFMADAASLPPLEQEEEEETHTTRQRQHRVYLTGRRLMADLSYCNYTTLTTGSGASIDRAEGISLLYLTMGMALLFSILTTLCVPSGMLTVAVWVVLFPMVLFWVTYGVSPLCWPMIPPRMPHDIAVEVQALVPESFEIPQFLVRRDCTVRGVLTDGTVGSSQQCFKQCSEDPFQMRSWQDPLAWWLCEASTSGCVYLANAVGRWSVFQDFASSASYYAEVLLFQTQDPDFAAAHRLCAFFTSHQICFACAGIAFAVLVLPSILVTVAEIFTGAVVLLMQAASAESVRGDSQ